MTINTNYLFRLSNYNLVNKIAVIGSGIAGTVAAIYLATHGVKVDLYEKEDAIFRKSSALPAHLYSGVQYFDDISKESIQHCMYSALSFAKTLPFCVNPRPTIIAIAKQDSRHPEKLEEACIMNREIYAQECLKDIRNQVFGEPARFYKKYTREQLEVLLENQLPEQINEDDRWATSFAKNTNLDVLQFPIFLVREYGMDMRHAAGFMEQLIKENENIKLHTSTEVQNVNLEQDGISISAQTNETIVSRKYSAVVDASGRNLGALENQLGIERSRMTDIKMAGLFKVATDNFIDAYFPEIYILGGKGQAPGNSFMSHISPINPAGVGDKRWMVINVTTPNCTYVADGKRSNHGKGSILVNSTTCPVATDVLNNRQEHLRRLVNMVEMVKQRHPLLGNHLLPVCGIPGSVDILGKEFSSRDSFVDVHRHKRFLSLNITKGGAAVGVAQDLIKEIFDNKTHYNVDSKNDLINPLFMPKDIKMALSLTKKRYSELGFSASESKIYNFVDSDHPKGDGIRSLKPS